ncbi:MAG: hypothetical protein ACPL3C_05710 [Pyrobaculum sp.]|uniref:hypothetical protein n=1 Tax=Pyrobaculum sp. TaxID=2004705 RepID=UPI003CBD9C36
MARGAAEGDYQPIVKAAYRIDKPLDAAKIVAEAYSIAASPPQGPVFIEVPEDVWSVSSEYMPCRAEVRLPPPVPVDGVKKVAELLSRARRVVILAGGGVNSEEGSRLLLQLAERWRIPVAVTGNGRGAFPEDHPLFLGRAGFGGGNIVADQALARADLVLAVGAGSPTRLPTATTTSPGGTSSWLTSTRWLKRSLFPTPYISTATQSIS